MENDDRTARRDRILKAALRYRDSLLTSALALLHDWAMAEDVVQDAFLVMVDKHEQFEEGTSVYAWARQIVHYKAMEALRKRAREIPREEEELQKAVEDVLTAHLDQEKAERQADRRQALERCMSQLGKFPLELLMGYYWKMQSCEKLANVHHRSANSVRLLLSRVRKRLESCMKQQMPRVVSGYE